LTTLESPLDPYVAHYSIIAGEAPDEATLDALRRDDAAAVREAIGEPGAEITQAYREWLLDSMVHELNGVRGLLGEPDRLEFASIRPEGITAVLTFGPVECVASWVDLPGSALYRQEWAFAASGRRALLEFPSPFLRNAPTRLILEDGSRGSPASARTEHVESYDGAFRRELVEFHEAIVEGRPPRTTGEDALHDIALCESIVRSAVSGRPIDAPSSIVVESGVTS
jgi:predicted dehydrogenase